MNIVQMWSELGFFLAPILWLLLVIPVFYVLLRFSNFTRTPGHAFLESGMMAFKIMLGVLVFRLVIVILF